MNKYISRVIRIYLDFAWMRKVGHCTKIEVNDPNYVQTFYYFGKATCTKKKLN